MNPFRYGPTYRDAAPSSRSTSGSQRLRDPEVRARSSPRSATYDGVADARSHLRIRSFAHLFPLGDPLEYEPTADAERRRDRRAATGRDPWAVAYDLLLGADGREFLLYPLLNFGRGSYDGLHDMMLDPDHASRDSATAARTAAIVCDASMTTYMLTHWVRDRTRGPRLPLECAVQRLTKRPGRPLRAERPRRARAGQAGRPEPHRLRRASRSGIPSG